MTRLQKLFFAVALAGGGMTLAPAPASAQVVEVSSQAAPARAATKSEVASYAEREKAAPKELKKFEGGQVFIAITTAGAVLLGIILLLVLAA